MFTKLWLNLQIPGTSTGKTRHLIPLLNSASSCLMKEKFKIVTSGHILKKCINGLKRPENQRNYKYFEKGKGSKIPQCDSW